MADEPTPDRKAFEEFLDDQTARDELDTLERAIGWTIRSTDLEFPDSVHCFGFWADPVDAMRAAEFHREEVNRDNSPESLGWSVEVQALLPFTGSEFPRQPGGDAGQRASDLTRERLDALDYGQGKTRVEESYDSMVILAVVMLVGLGVFAIGGFLVARWLG